MRPILYEQDEKQFRSNGIGILHDAEECKVTEARNGKFELEMEYPIQGDWATEIVQNRYILTKPNDIDELHAFRIYEVQSDLAQNKLTVKAVSKSDELSGNVVKPFIAGSKTPKELWDTILKNAVDPVAYSFHSDLVLRTDYQSESISNVLALLSGEENSITSIYGGEIKRTNDEIYLYRSRGREHVTTIRPRKNLKNIKITTNMNGKFTRILPYAKYTPEGENQKEITVYGDIVKSDHFDDYSQKRIVAVDITNKFDDEKKRLQEQRKEQLKAEKENNKAKDADKRKENEAKAAALEEERERKRIQNHEEQRQKRLQNRGTSSRRGRGNSAARRAEADAKWERQWQQREKERLERRAAAKKSKADKKAAQEAERAARKARQDKIKDDTKFVITSAMVSSEALTYFEENPNIDVPNIKIEVDMVPLQDTTAYERAIIKALVDAQLCDTIDVYVPKIDVDITLKISEIEYDSMKERILKIIATSDGNNQSTLADVQRAEWKDLTKKEVNESMDYFKGSINTIMESANGKNRNFYGPDEPPAEGLKENDMWFKDIGSGETEMYRYDGTQWVLVMPTNFNEMINEQIDSIMDEVADLFDQYEMSNEQLQEEIDRVTQDALSAIADAEHTIREELGTAKSKLEQVSTDFNESKQYLSNKIVELSQRQLDDGRALLTKIEKDVKNLEDGITEKYSNLRIGTNNLLPNTKDMPSSIYNGWSPVTTEKFRLYSKDLSILSTSYSSSTITLIFNPPTDKQVILRPGEKYIFSFYAKATNNASILDINIKGNSDVEIVEFSPGKNSGGWTLTNEWTRYWVKIQTQSTMNTNIFAVSMYNVNGNKDSSIYTSAWQLEESHILSDWHPNENDIEETLAVYKRTIDQNLSQLEQTIGNINKGLTNVRSSINQTNKSITSTVQEIKTVKQVVDHNKTQIEQLPNSISLKINSAKEDAIRGAKEYTNTEIKASEGRIVQRVTQNVPGTVESLITSSITQDSGKIRQAITRSMTEFGANVRNETQNIVTREVGRVQERLAEVTTTIPKKYGGRNYLSQTDRTRYSDEYTLGPNGYSVILGYSLIGGKTFNELGIPKNSEITVQFKVRFKQSVSNAGVRAEIYNKTNFLQGFDNVVGYPEINGKNINGSTWNFRVGRVRLSNNSWEFGNQIRFRVDDSRNVEFEIIECTLYTGDMIMDWVAAAEDNLLDSSSQNLVRNGNFQYNANENEKLKTDYWTLNSGTGLTIDTTGNNTFSYFGKKGIIHAYGKSPVGGFISQDIVDKFRKGDPITVSLDIARENMSGWDSAFLRISVHTTYNGNTKEYIKDFYKSDPEFVDMKAGVKILRRVGATFIPETDADKIKVVVYFIPNAYVSFYLTNIQVERSKNVNGFKDHPLDIDITKNVKFHQVTQTVDMFTRTLGVSENGIPTKIAEMVMNNDRFQTTVTNRASAGTNLVLDTETFEGAKTNFIPNMGAMSPIPGRYGKNSFRILITRNQQSPNRWVGVTLPMALSVMNPGEVYTVRFKYYIDRSIDIDGEGSYAVEIKDHTRNKSQGIFYLSADQNRNNHEIKLGAWTEYTKTFTVREKLIFDSTNMMPFYVWVDKIGNFSISEIMIVRGNTIGEYIPATGISSTIVKQLADSYAIRVLDSGSKLVTEVNATPDGVRIKGKSIELDGQAIIHNGIIKQGMIGNAAIGSAQIGKAVIDSSHIKYVDVKKITGLRAEFEDLMATTGTIDSIFAKGIDIGDRTRLRASNGSLSVMGNHGSWDSSSTAATIRTNGRYFGPTWFHGRQTTSQDYTPVMTNAWVNHPLSTVRKDINIYAVRGLFLITFKGQSNEYGSSAWLYVNDGSNQNHTYYVPLERAQTQVDWNNGFR
jgi:phage minor structural protein, N-terminal domain protein